jgi:syntaxin-binding protein 5
VEDDDQPLLVQTLDSTHVNLVDFDALADSDNKEKNQVQKLTREPIFKLSWSSFSNSSDPRGGETTLTILGGLDSSKPPGLTVFLLPPFNPTEPPTPLSPKNENLHPFFRSSMISSLNLSKSFFYETFGSVVQDYLLIPRKSPHLAGNFDPYAILLLTESTHNARTVRAYQYPPPGFVKANLDPPGAPIKVETKEDSEELPAASIQSPPPPTPPEKSPRPINYTPSPIRTPFTLSAASSGILGGYLFKIENDVYQSFTDEDFNELHLTLKGGQIYADPDLKLSKVCHYIGCLLESRKYFSIESTSSCPCDLQPRSERPIL